MKPSESYDCAIGGCPREITVMGSILRAGLQILDLPGEVYKVRLGEAPDVAKLMRSLARGKLSALVLSGPLGHETLRMIDHVSPSARQADGADFLLSTATGVVGHNATYLAFVDLMQETKTQRSTALVVGAGPRACAIVAACHTLGFGVVGVTSRSWISTEALLESPSAERIRKLGALPTLWPLANPRSGSSHFSQEMRLQFRELAVSANLLVQTVSVNPSTKDATALAEIIPWKQTRRDAHVCDLVYGAEPTPFMVEAQYQNRARVGGIEMLTRCGLRLIEEWTGKLCPKALLHAAALRSCARMVE